MNGCFHTSDMTLVAYLAVRAIAHDRMELNGDEVVWFFLDSKALSRELDLYRQGKALVEPVEIVRQVARTRRQLFQFKELQRQDA